MADEILTASNICKTYDGVRALQGADFSLWGGEVHALMGENGAGKSTLAKVIAGAVKADEGQIQLHGQTVSIGGPLEAQRLGVSIIFQELDLFPDLSIAENITIANREFSQRAIVRFDALDRFAEPYLRQVGLSVSPRRRVATLSIGEMQLVSIARALSMRARILIMDEPTSSLFHDSVERLFELIGKLRAQGVSVIYVSHKMDEIFRICDRMTVMRDGRTIGTRAKEETTSIELISMMVGREWRAGARQDQAPSDEVVFSASGLRTKKLKNVSFELRRGEILGIAGLVGAGRSEIGAALVGLDRLQEGLLTVHGRPTCLASVGEASRHGVRLLAEDRKLDGLMMQMSVLENGTMADLPQLAFAGLTNHRREEKTAAPIFRKLRLKSPSLDAPVSSLSGGGQQKVLFARCLMGDPEVLFLDDPTRGIDVGAKEDIYGIIEELARRGKGVIFVSSELPELLRCCHRILVMREGQVTATLDARNTTQEEIMAFATNPVSSQKENTWPN